MKCEEVPKELIAYLGRRIDSSKHRELEQHLAGCVACRTRAEEFRKVWSVMDEMPAIEPSFGFDARVRQRVASEPARSWVMWLAPQSRLAFASVLLIALTVWMAKLPANNPGPTNALSPTSSEQDFNAIKDLGVLENYDVVTKMDALSELVPAAAPQTEKPSQTESND